MGLSPGDFWAMSLTEWRAAVEGFAMRRGARRNVALGRAEFEVMMRKFPD